MIILSLLEYYDAMAALHPDNPAWAQAARERGRLVLKRRLRAGNILHTPRAPLAGLVLTELRLRQGSYYRMRDCSFVVSADPRVHRALGRARRRRRA